MRDRRAYFLISRHSGYMRGTDLYCGMADEQNDKVTIWGGKQMKYFKSGKSVFSNWIIGIALILGFCACSEEKND